MGTESWSSPAEFILFWWGAGIMFHSCLHVLAWLCRPSWFVEAFKGIRRGSARRGN